MLGLNWLKIALYGGSALLVIGMLWTINSWRNDSKELAGVKDSLTAERSCLVGTTCETRIRANAEQASREVAKAQEEAARQNKDAKERSEAQANEYANHITKASSQHQADLAKIKSHQNSPSCEEQRKQVILCALQ